MTTNAKTKRRRSRRCDTTGDLFDRQQTAPPANPPAPPLTTGKLSPPTELHTAIHKALHKVLIDTPNPAEFATETAQDDWLPARMLNEFVYCPRLFFFEHAEGIFVHNADTEKGKQVHSRVDSGKGNLPSPDATTSDSALETIHSRSVQMGSERLRVNAKMDLVELDTNSREVVPVDYKVGSPREGADASSLWPADRMQLGLQILILRDNGYRCTRGIIYYRATKQRIQLEMNPEIESWIASEIANARALLKTNIRPEPLVDSPKCPRCSLVSVCLPDETKYLARQTIPDGPPENPHVRRLIASRDDVRALYLNTQGVHVGIKDRVLEVREKDQKLDSVRLSDIHHVALFGNIQLSTQALQQLLREEIPVLYFSTGGWFYGLTRGHAHTNILLRKAQFQKADNPEFCLKTARECIAGKIRNARTMLLRNSSPQPEHAILRLKHAIQDAAAATSIAELLGIEGAAAATYFSHFPTMLKVEDDIPGLAAPQTDAPAMSFDFQGRNRRPPVDPVNAMLSLAYSMLAKDCMIALLTAGLDPWLGFYHQPRPGRPALALDLVEEFRPLIAESVVLTVVNNQMILPSDFVRAGKAVNLGEHGRKKFFLAYEQRMNALITHPVFDYKVSYRRAIELQARLLGRVIEGEIPAYIPLVTR